MSEDGGHGDGGLESEGEANGGDEGGEEGAGELSCVEEGAEDGHCFVRGYENDGRTRLVGRIGGGKELYVELFEADGMGLGSDDIPWF